MTEHSALLTIENRLKRVQQAEVDDVEDQMQATTTTTTTLAMCCDYLCPMGFTNVHGVIGDTEDECCETTCADFCCPVGMTLKENAATIEGQGHDANLCCTDWCGDYICPAGYRSKGDDLGTANTETCCEACACNGCDVCDDDASTCQKCSVGFRLNEVSGQCEACQEEGCESCETDAAMCDKCQSGHHFCESDRTCLACDDEECETCGSDQGTCESCKQGHRMNPDTSECQACTQSNCATCCSDLGRCDSCPEGYELDAVAGTCTMDNSCAAPHCVRCSTDCASTCLECEDGYSLEDGRCTPCAIQNCESCAKNVDQCDKCQANHAYEHTTRACVPCTSATECLSCESSDTSKCDACPAGFKLSWGACLPCTAANCKSCQEDVARCSACHPGFHFDHEHGHCIATQPTPLDGQCFGLPTPFELVQTGNCGERNFWLSCDAAKGGAKECFDAVMAEPQCLKDYFTFNARGDRNCGCKVSSEDTLVVYSTDLSDCYVITNATTTPTTPAIDVITTTTTCAPTTA